MRTITLVMIDFLLALSSGCFGKQIVAPSLKTYGFWGVFTCFIYLDFCTIASVRPRSYDPFAAPSRMTAVSATETFRPHMTARNTEAVRTLPTIGARMPTDSPAASANQTYNQQERRRSNRRLND